MLVFVMAGYLGVALQAKLKAAGLHGLGTIVVAGLASVLVFLVWYGEGLAGYVGGTQLFLIVLGVEVCLGPLMSLVIYNTSKPIKELRRDYVVILLLQAAALGYGLYVTYLSRPVYIVHVVDSLHVITALELQGTDIAGDRKYSSLPVAGPRWVCTERPVDPELRSELIFSALSGKDIEYYPEYYRPCKGNEVEAVAFSADMLEAKLNAATQQADRLSTKTPVGRYSWVPVRGRFGNWVRIYPEYGEPYFLDFDPWAVVSTGNSS